MRFVVRGVLRVAAILIVGFVGVGIVYMDRDCRGGGCVLLFVCECECMCARSCTCQGWNMSCASVSSLHDIRHSHDRIYRAPMPTTTYVVGLKPDVV